MIILLALYLVLGWTFPTALWVVSGFFFLIGLIPKKNKKANFKIISNSIGLPLFLVLAIYFGKSVDGSFIFPETGNVWILVGLYIGSILFRVIISRPDKIIKEQISKQKQVDADENIDDSDESDDDELKLHFSIKNKEKNKTSNFKITLNNGFIKEKFVENIILKGVKKGWENNPDYQDNEGNPLFNIEDIYNEAKKNPIKGEIITIDNEKVNITISIK